MQMENNTTQQHLRQPNANGKQHNTTTLEDNPLSFCYNNIIDLRLRLLL